VARLPGQEAFGQTPLPTAPRGISTYSPTSGMEMGPASGLAQSAADLADASQIALRMKEQHDGLRAEDAFNQLRKNQIELTYGKDGYSNLKGANAVNKPVLKDYGTRFDQTAQNISSGLDNEYQKQLFQKRAQVTGLEFRQGLVTHIAKESDVYANNVFKGTLQTEIDSATANPATTDLSLTRIDNAINSQAERFGAPKEWVDAAKTDARSKLYAAQVVTQMAHDPLVAQAYYNAHKNEIDSKTRPVLEMQIHRAVMPIEAKNVADEVFAQLAKSPRKSDMQAQLGDLLDTGATMADKVHPNDPVFRDLVQQQIKGYVSTQVSAAAGRARAAYGVLLSAADGVSGTPKPTTIDQLLATPAARQAWNTIEPTGQRALIALLDHNAKESVGTPMKADGHVIEDLNNRIYLPANDPRKITQVSQLVPYLNHGLDRPALDWLTKRWEEYQTPDGRKLTDTREAYFRDIKRQFDHSTLMTPDEKGLENFNKFKQYILQKETRGEGVDPYELYNKDSKDYASNFIPTFQRSLQEQMQDQLKALNRPAQPIPPPVKNPSAQVIFEPGKAYQFSQGWYTYRGPANPTQAQKNDPANWIPGYGGRVGVQ